MSRRASDPVRAILFDADGVIQRTRGNWREQFAALLGLDDQLDTFIAELFASEKPCLIGQADFESQLAAVLGRWDSSGTVADALSISENIEADADVLAMIASLRRISAGARRVFHRRCRGERRVGIAFRNPQRAFCRERRRHGVA